MNILIADDEKNNRLLLEGFLSSLGRCDLVVNGQEAVEAFEMAVAEGEPYDFICLDLFMPEKNGDLALQEIRFIEKESGVPSQYEAVVFMVTGEDQKGVAIESYYQGGCTDYIVKPVTKGKLFEKLREHGLIAADVADCGVENTPATGGPLVFPDLPGIHVASGLERLGPVTERSVQFFRDGLLGFREDHGHEDQTIREALNRGDLETAHRRAHGIKGVAAMFGAENLHKAALDLEIALKAVVARDEQMAKLSVFAEALRQVVHSIARLDS